MPDSKSNAPDPDRSPIDQLLELEELDDAAPVVIFCSYNTDAAEDRTLPEAPYSKSRCRASR